MQYDPAKRMNAKASLIFQEIVRAETHRGVLEEYYEVRARSIIPPDSKRLPIVGAGHFVKYQATHRGVLEGYYKVRAIHVRQLVQVSLNTPPTRKCIIGSDAFLWLGDSGGFRPR